MKADDLILFSDVTETGSFTQAANKNGLTPSVVSKRIARLEAQLSVPLFYRTTRKLTLTEAGRELLDGALQVRALTQQTFDSVSDFGQRLTGHLRVSAPVVSGEMVLASAINQFCSMHPGLTIELSLDNRFVDLIEEGFDLVIRTGYLDDSSLIARHLIDSHWVVCASSMYVKKQGKVTSFTELSGHNCLQYTGQVAGASDWAFISDGDSVIQHVEGNFASDSLSTLRAAALAGYGIIYVPRLLVWEDIRDGNLVELLPQQVAKHPGIYAVYPFSRHPPEKVRLLIDHIKTQYALVSERF